MRSITREELLEDPKDIIANWLTSLSQSFSLSAQHFGVLYLASHGIIKCVLVWLLWRKKLWAYPAAVAVLVLFIAYQIYRIAISPSVMMIALTAFDIVMIVLTLLEYSRVKEMRTY